MRWQGEPKAASARTFPELLRLIPGIVDAEVRRALGVSDQGSAELIALSRDHWLVPPECRLDPAKVSRFEFDRLSARTHSIGWLRAYAQFRGNNYYVEPPFLGRQGWQRFAEGGEFLALSLIERALECAATPSEEAILQVQAQGMRIAMRDFASVASVADPLPTVPGALRGTLQANGWGSVQRPAGRRTIFAAPCNCSDRTNIVAKHFT